MNVSGYLAGLILMVLLASACLVAILIYFDPGASGILIFVLFYLSLLITATGLLSLIGFFIRQISRKRKFSMPESQVIRNLEVSYRQGFLFSVILISVLILQSQRVLAWWHLIVLVGLVGLAEWWLTKH